MKKGFSRRSFIGTTCGSFVGAALLPHVKAVETALETKEKPQSRIAAASKFSPSPYKLAGKRLIFTNWSYIQPGRFGWFNGTGAQDLLDTANPEALHIRHFNEPFGIRITAQPATRVGPLLKPEYAWEQAGTSIQTVFREDGVYRAWSVTSPVILHNYQCYMESVDGWNWKRPKLGIYDLDGSRQNNLLFYVGWNQTIFIDPTAPSKERYKMVLIEHAHPVNESAVRALATRPWHGVGGATSPDGLHWKFFPEPICKDYNDTQNTAYYDESLGKYVLYNRKIIHGRRAIGRSESKDFRKFPFPDLIVEPGMHLQPYDDLYMNCRTTIPGAPDHHLMFPTIYHLSGDIGTIRMLSSFDGKVWHWLRGPDAITPAAGAQWDSGWLTAHPNLIELPNGDFALPYTGQNTPHKYPRGQLTYAGGYGIWPKGRIVALEALDRGQFSTFAIIPPARKLLLNAVTERAGGIAIEVATLEKEVPANDLEEGFKVLSGRSFANSKLIVGDHYKTPAVWNGQEDLGHIEGRPILLRFRLEKAKLFGLEFQ